MINNSIVYLFLPILMFIILLNHLKCKNNIETFFDKGDVKEGETDNRTQKEIEKSIQDNILSIKENRNQLSEAVVDLKKNKKVEYINKLITKLENERESINKKVDEKKQNNDYKLNKIKKLIFYLNNMITENTLDLNTDIHSIKSLYDGEKISIKKIKDKNTYLINLTDSNNKIKNSCLSINSDSNITTDSCDEDDPKQYFELTNILNPSMYKDNIDPSIYNPYNGNDLVYPFTMVKSFHNNNCLKNEHGEVSVVPCVIKRSQRWKTFEDEINCSK